MKITATAIPDVLIIEPTVIHDRRGFFLESFNRREFTKIIDREIEFVQDNHSRSVKNVLRGLHYQVVKPQGKLIRVISGEIFDVAVDVRRSSPTFGHYVSVHLSAERKELLWIPEGFAHGFMALSEYAEVLYKVTEYWDPNLERTINWNDPAISIQWPLHHGAPILSKKDQNAMLLEKAENFT